MVPYQTLMWGDIPAFGWCIHPLILPGKAKPLNPSSSSPLMGEGKGGGEVNYEMGFPEDAPMKPPGGFLNPFGGPFLNRFFR
jgi:hypothetical protein